MSGKRAKPPELTDYEALVTLVAANPRAWLRIGELALYFRMPEPIVSAACNAKDSPFIGKSCNTALFDKWLHDHQGIPSASSIELREDKAKEGLKKGKG